MSGDREIAQEVGLDLVQNGGFLKLGNGEMRDHFGELATIRRSLWPPISDRLCELPQLRVRFRDEIQDLGEMSASLESQVEGSVAVQGVGEGRVDQSVYTALFEEREEHGHMCWDTGSG